MSALNEIYLTNENEDLKFTIDLLKNELDSIYSESLNGIGYNPNISWHPKFDRANNCIGFCRE